MRINYENAAEDDTKPLLLNETSTESENVDLPQPSFEPSSRYLKLEAAKKHLDMKEPENHYRYLRHLDTDEAKAESHKTIECGDHKVLFPFTPYPQQE